MYANKYAKHCHNPACKTLVGVGEGFIQRINVRGKDTWLTWCKQCVPERKVDSRREITADGKLFIPYEPANLDLVRSFPGARFVPATEGGPHWSVSVHLKDRLRVLELADKLQLEVPQVLRDMPIPETVIEARSAGLKPFQVEGVHFLSNRSRALLGDEMGLGKTIQALMAMPKDVSGLVICPAGLTYNWRDETRRWRPDVKVTVIDSSKDFRFPEIDEIVIVSYDNVPDLFLPPPQKAGQVSKVYYAALQIWHEELKIKYPVLDRLTVVVDEAHNFKNHETIGSRKINTLSRIVKTLWGLTGSPLMNRQTELYAIFQALNLAYETFGSFDNFKKLFNASVRQVARGRYVTVWGDPQPVVPERMRRTMLRRTRQQVMPELPKKTYTTLTVGNIDTDLKNELDHLWDTYGGQIEIDESLPPFEKFSEIRAKLAKSRIPAMLEYVAEAEEQEVPLVVFSDHLAPIDALMLRKGWKVITGTTKPEKRQEIVNEFQAGKLKGVGISTRAGGVGLTLTRAWKALFVDLNWTPGINAQAEDRICRIGQLSDMVEIIRMVSDHVLDLHVLNILSEKIRLIEAAVERLIVPQTPAQTQKSETQEEFEQRMAQIQAAQLRLEQEQLATAVQNQKLRGKAKASKIHNREQQKATRPILTLTPERIEAVKKAFGYMLSICDGAKSLDGMGFSKPDASVARYLEWAGLENQVELEAAYFMLNRYHRQLSSSYPVLFK